MFNGDRGVEGTSVRMWKSRSRTAVCRVRQAGSAPRMCQTEEKSPIQLTERYSTLEGPIPLQQRLRSPAR